MDHPPYRGQAMHSGLLCFPSLLFAIELDALVWIGGRKIVMDIAGLVSNRADLLVTSSFLGLQWTGYYNLGRALANAVRSANSALGLAFIH